MSKYDFDLDLSDTSSTGIILKKIKPESTVLEFGCATGRMTRYMKTVLNCKVYIVEYEKSAFDIAMQYAEDGVCDDILTLTWVEKFRDIKFDAVIFADVLEHLAQPKLALSNVNKLLKKEGQVYISVPNITHNDILIKAMNNRFDYTEVGILDNTHIHFWGFDNIEPFILECGLSLQKIESTYCETGHTEQLIGNEVSVSRQITNYLNERDCGNIYQFIITAGSEQVCINENEKFFKPAIIKSHVYYDEGFGFNAQNIYEFNSEMIESGKYVAHFVLKNIEKIKSIRFDPIEHQGCILCYLSIRQEGLQLKPIFNEHIEIEDGIWLTSDDPMVCVDIRPDGGAVIIDAEIMIANQEYETKIQNLCISKHQECLQLKNVFSAEKEGLQSQIGQLGVEKEGLQSQIDQLSAEKEGLENQIGQLGEEKERLQSQIKQIDAEKESLRENANRIIEEYQSLQIDLGAYVVLANNKDVLLISKEQHINELEQNLIGKEQHINELEQKVLWYSNRRCVKMFDKMWAMLTYIKHRIFRR